MNSQKGKNNNSPGRNPGDNKHHATPPDKPGVKADKSGKAVADGKGGKKI
jgi:hypothetical protein